MPASPVRANPAATSASPGWLKRALSNLEPILQHQGVECTFVLVYALANVFFFFLGASPAWRRPDLISQGFVMRAATALARAGGAMLDFNSACIILVAARALMTLLRRTFLNMFVPFDKAMPAFHSLIGNFLFFSTILHASAHVVRYAVGSLKGPGFFGATSLAITGSFLTLIVTTIRITAMLRVRKRSFETFYWVHHIGFILYFILLILHGSHNGHLKAWMYVLFPVTVYVLDRALRLSKEQGSRLSVSRESAIVKGTDVVNIRIPRIFSYIAGQYCDIKVPQVSNVEWHPFTIASSPHESEMLFYIKVNGDWTRKLYDLLKQRETDNEDISIHVRGPYGAPAQHVGQYEHVVLVSGGVGATPFCSITKFAHNWMLNFTERGALASNSVSAAFTRNQSVQGTPSVPGTPTPHGSSGYASARHSRNASRPLSRNQSNNFSPGVSRNFSRNGSRGASRPISRSGSGRLDRFNSGRRPDSGRSLPMSRTPSSNMDRLAAGIPLSALARSSSGGGMDRVTSSRTSDSVAAVIHEQRLHQPYGPNSSNSVSSAEATGILPPDTVGRVVHEGLLTPPRSMDDGTLRRLVEDEEVIDEMEDNEFTRPDDYDEELGNPELPIPDRRAMHQSPSVSQNRASAFEIIKEYDSSQALFDEDEEHVEEEEDAHVISRGGLVHGVLEEDLRVDGEGVGLELEDEILRETAISNAYNLLGMSFGPMSMMRHMKAMDANKMRSSVVRTSVNLMDDAMDASLWQDRLLFYFHTVTANWLVVWIMLFRFTLLFIALPAQLFSVQQLGLGVFSSVAMNVVDLTLGALVTLLIFGAIIMEMYVNHVESFLAETIANSFDLFVVVPLLVCCIVLHVLNFVGIASDVQHVSKLTVGLIWPLLLSFIMWRVARTIGSRVLLAPSLRSSHAQTKSLDYIWVSKTHEDDSWVVEELLPLSESNIIRLHRFITRHGPKTEPWMLEYEKVPLKTTYSRPDWDDVFGTLVERSKSGTVIGVFFCGPDTMARMIRQAAMKAMAKSMENAYQRGYFTKKAGGTVPRSESSNGATAEANAASSGGAGGGGGPDSRGFGAGSYRSLEGMRLGSKGPGGGKEKDEDSSAYGCSVRIAIRVENFT